MEPIILIYIGAVSILGLLASNFVNKNNSIKKENIHKKKFKHYRSI